MPMLPITAFWIAVAAIALVALSLPVALHRKRSLTSLGDGGDSMLQRRIRAHGNFTEYVPLGLLVIAAVEACGYASWIVWAVSGLLALGRLSHAIALLGGTLPLRMLGMIATFLSLIGGAGLILVCLAQGL